MSRPQRIEFDDAYYHVLNRGAGRRDIFDDDNDREQFLTTVKEAHTQFGIEIHAYCLMSNHYHLLIKTPRGNLGRAMRHINGVFTQRLNRAKDTDGPLFRGRYKAILVDSDAYLLHLSKYIHLNPLAARMVNDLEHYPWSSYSAYVDRVPSPSWLVRSEVYGQISESSNKAEHYRLFMEDIVLNEALITFYAKQRLAPVLGDELFINKLCLSDESTETPRKDRVVKRPSLTEIVAETGKAFGISVEGVLSNQKGRGRKNMPRKIAMYIGQKIGDYRLNEMASFFGLRHYGGVSSAIYSVVEALKLDEILSKKINSIINRLDP